MKNVPKISCLTATLNRFDALKKSIACFCKQDYPNKELVIATEGATAFKHLVSTHINALNRSDIRLVLLEGEDYTLGNVRNKLLDAASGEIVCQWDDDDLFHPRRLSIQAAYMIESEAAACVMTEQLQYFTSSGELFWLNWAKKGYTGMARLIPGTLMMYANPHFRYPESGEFARAGEDTILLEQLYQHVKLAELKGYGWLYVYQFHGENTFGEAHHWAIAKYRSTTREHILKNRLLLEAALSLYELPLPVKVMDHTLSLAFSYPSELPSSRFEAHEEEETWYSLLKIAKDQQAQGVEWGVVMDAFLKAYEFRPSRAEPLYEIVKYCRENKQFHSGYLFAKRLLEIPYPGDGLHIDKPVYDYLAAFETAICAYYVGDDETAIRLNTTLMHRKDIPAQFSKQARANLQFSLDRLGKEALLRRKDSLPISSPQPLSARPLAGIRVFACSLGTTNSNEISFLNLIKVLNQAGAEIWHTSESPTLEEVQIWGPSLIISENQSAGKGHLYATHAGVPFVMYIDGPDQFEPFFDDSQDCDLVIFTSPQEQELVLQKFPDLRSEIFLGNDLILEALLDLG